MFKETENRAGIKLTEKSLFLTFPILLRSATFQKPAQFPSSGKAAPNLADP